MASRPPKNDCTENGNAEGDTANNNGSGSSGSNTAQNQKKRIIVAGQEHRFELDEKDYFHDETGNEKDYDSGEKVTATTSDDKKKKAAAALKDDQESMPDPTHQVTDPQHLGHLAHRAQAQHK
jgi:hypothetical protein